LNGLTITEYSAEQNRHAKRENHCTCYVH